MTYNPNVPNASQSPNLFPDQMHTNLARLKKIIDADHVFNDTDQVNDGIHKQVKILNRLPPSSLINGESGIAFGFANSLAQSNFWYFNGVQQNPLSSVKAFVSFDGTTVNPTIRTGALNVVSVTRFAGGSNAGRYRITFGSPFIASAYGDTYVTQITVMNSTFDVIGNLRQNTTVAQSQTDLYVDIETVNLAGTHVDCVYVGVTIHSYL